MKSFVKVINPPSICHLIVKKEAPSLSPPFPCLTMHHFADVTLLQKKEIPQDLHFNAVFVQTTENKMMCKECNVELYIVPFFEICHN